MTGFVTGLTTSTAESLAPDQASLKAAGKLLKPAKWPLRETDGSYIWAECQGSGANPYRVIFDLRDHGYKCTCPSRKFPCKHTLALMILYAEGAADFSPGSIPQWGSDWIGRRRGAVPKPADDTPKPKVSLSKALRDDPAKPDDPKRTAATEAARQTRAKATRDTQLAGLQDLETWIADQLSLGLPQLLGALPERCRTIAARMADAKAPSLSGRIDDIPERVLSLPAPARPDALIEELGKLVLLSRAMRSEPPHPGVTRLVASAESREEVLSDVHAESLQAVWQVVACHSRTRKDGLVAHSTWALACGEVARFANLLDFVPASLGKRGAGFTVGDTFEAEMVFYPGSATRAVIRQRSPSEAALWPQAADLPDQLSQALAQAPWTQDMPVLLGPGRLADLGGQTVWTATGMAQPDSAPVPVAQDRLPALTFGLPLTATAALWAHGRLRLLASQTPLGTMFHDD